MNTPSTAALLHQTFQCLVEQLAAEPQEAGYRDIRSPGLSRWLRRAGWKGSARETFWRQGSRPIPAAIFRLAGPILKRVLRRHLDAVHATLKALLDDVTAALGQPKGESG